MNTPLVSVVCLCFNHKEFVVEAMESVLNQTYDNVELIIVDDASNDGSQEVINAFCEAKPDVVMLLLDENIGHCGAFNHGWRSARGKYIIDLAADDYLLPERIAVGVKRLEELGSSFGIHYTDVRIIDKAGQRLNEHLTAAYYRPVPEGYIFKEVLEKYFINPVSMMITNEVLKDLGGYDESLAYEDFDLWVRSARRWQYCYTDKVLVAKRLLKKSQSAGQYAFNSAMLASTHKVCQKAFLLCENQEEFAALKVRVSFELRKSIQSFNLKTARNFYTLRQRVNNRLKELS